MGLSCGLWHTLPEWRSRKAGLSYPKGNSQGQAGWHVTILFTSLSDLAKKLSSGVAMPKEFCGNIFDDCDPITKGEINRLAFLAHGDQGGVWAANGKKGTLVTADKSCNLPI